ncbi:tubby C-terminal-like domain-containing protein [Xylariales sp. PMI_506]|nr:tubby C-terminal-like domain-containing protein [Xylariales sp. PMI_506]
MFMPFVAHQPETLIIKEKLMSLSGDSFDIKTRDGRPIFKIKGNAFSLSGRKELSDAAGNALFTIRKRHLKLHDTYYAEDPQGREILEVAGKFSFMSSKAVCTFTSASGKAESLSMKGDWFDLSADIVDDSTGRPVASISRRMVNARELIGGQQTYQVTISPGVDMAVIVAMCIALDERRNEK